MGSECLQMTVESSSSQAFAMQENLGNLWPTSIFHAEKGRAPHPDELRTVKGITGVLLPDEPGKALPIGVFKLFNVAKDSIEKKRLVEDSTHARSKLMEGQVDKAYTNMAEQVKASIQPSMRYDEHGALVTAEKEKDAEDEEGDQSKLPATKKRKLAKQDSNQTSNGSDDWFDGRLPTQKKNVGAKGRGRISSQPSGSGQTAKPKREPRTLPAGGRGQKQKRRDSVGSSSQAASAAAPQLEEGGLNWRARANKVRKLGACRTTIGAADEYLEQFSSADWHKLKSDVIGKHIDKLMAQNNDQSLIALLRDSTSNAISNEGIELRDSLQQRQSKLCAIRDFLLSFAALESSGDGGAERALDLLKAADALSSSSVAQHSSIALKLFKLFVLEVYRSGNVVATRSCYRDDMEIHESAGAIHILCNHSQYYDGCALLMFVISSGLHMPVSLVLFTPYL
jgi:hypothetical protein